ncbi:hypothetical protein ACJX0J_027704 [Zea mays]
MPRMTTTSTRIIKAIVWLDQNRAMFHVLSDFHNIEELIIMSKYIQGEIKPWNSDFQIVYVFLILSNQFECEQKIAAIEAVEALETCNIHMEETMRNYKLIIATCTCKLKLRTPIYENKNRVICWEEIFSLMKAVAFSGLTSTKSFPIYENKNVYINASMSL